MNDGVVIAIEPVNHLEVGWHNTIAEAARLAKPGGTIAFTDWLEGPQAMTDAEAQRYREFMKFANVLSLADYAELWSR